MMKEKMGKLNKIKNEQMKKSSEQNSQKFNSVLNMHFILQIKNNIE